MEQHEVENTQSYQLYQLKNGKWWAKHAFYLTADEATRVGNMLDYPFCVVWVETTETRTIVHEGVPHASQEQTAGHP